MIVQPDNAVADPQQIITDLQRRLDESVAQQAATAEVMQLINASPFDLAPVFDAITDKAMHLCDAGFGGLWVVEGDLARAAATRNLPEAYTEFLTHRSMPQAEAFGPNMKDRPVVHIADLSATESYRRRVPITVASVELGGIRTYLAVPLREGAALAGVISLYRKEVRAFTDGQIALVQGFAAQAEIAMKNARLFDEVQARTRELSESLEQQTATSEVLEVISALTGELEPVFRKMLENATRVCGANFGTMSLYDGESFHSVARHNTPPAFAGAVRPFRPHPKSGMATVASTRQAVQIEDLRTQPPYLEGDPAVVALSDLAGARTLITIPMLRENELIGVISIFRQEVRPFTDKQVELVANFAKQALIAIENARLLRELRARTDDLSESLQQQTATADVLKVISRSAFDLQAVFDTLLSSAVALSGAVGGAICVRDGDVFPYRATVGASPEFARFLAENPATPGRHSIAGRVILSGEVVAMPDFLEDSEYRMPAVLLNQMTRSHLGVPLLRNDKVEGALVLVRVEPGLFEPRQIELVKTFADQAVIAIENVRLFDEVQAKTRDLTEALTYQTGSGNILRVIASSPTDVGPVLKAIVESACELCGAYDAVVRLKNGDDLQFSAHHGPVPTTTDKWLINRNSATGRSVLDRKPVHLHDMQSAEGDEFPESQARARHLGHRTLLSVPLLREGESIGVIVLRRTEVHPFSDKQIALLQTFADQAVIAIGNVRLFEQVQERTKELSLSLDNLRTAQDRLIQTEKLASLGQLTAGIAHEIKNPLNFVNNFSALSVELVDELDEVLKPAVLEQKTRKETDELTHMLKGNLEKVVQHGKRADSIVKNMLLHSREGSGEHRPADINAIVDESLNLAYHGARAEKAGFSIAFQRDLDPSVGMADIYPQEITRVLLNLISNGFYATTKRRAEVGDGFEPMLSAATKNLGDKVEIRIRDNGTGIPEGVKEKIFNPFFTTKPSGEGTGLGLSMSHDIIVKQHGGSLDVETDPGVFTEFKIVLPRTSQR
jgi:two-component system, NtrC family, sensor kinase